MRSEAYLQADDWHNAAVEFRRAVAGFPEYTNAVDRWREIGPQLEDIYIAQDFR